LSDLLVLVKMQWWKTIDRGPTQATTASPLYHSRVHSSLRRLFRTWSGSCGQCPPVLSLEQNNKSAWYMKQIILVETPLQSLISFSTKSKQAACLLSPLDLALIHPHEANQQTKSKQRHQPDQLGAAVWHSPTACSDRQPARMMTDSAVLQHTLPWGSEGGDAAGGRRHTTLPPASSPPRRTREVWGNEGARL
jgi:hypothetical protein